MDNKHHQEGYPTMLAYAYQGDTSTHESHQRFLSYFGMLSNSYFAKPLLFVTFVVSTVNVMVLSITFIVIPRLGIDSYQNSTCETYLKQMVWGNVFGVLNIALAFPATSIMSCKLYTSDKKITNFHLLCLALITLETVALVANGIVMIVASSQHGKKCFETLEEGWKTWFIIAFCGIIVFYIGAWYQIAIFDKFKSHYSGQLGLGTGGNRLQQPKSNPIGKKIKSFFSKRQSHALKMQRELYKATFIGDSLMLANALEECKKVYGIRFASEFYGSANVYFGFMAVSTHNPLHVACAQGRTLLVEKLLDAGFEINHFDKLIPYNLGIESIYRLILDHLPWISLINKRQINTDVYGVSSRVTQIILTPLHCAVANDHLPVVNLLVSRGALLNVYAKSTMRTLRVPPIFMVQSSEIADALIRAGANHLAIPSRSFVRTIYEVSFQHSKLALSRSLAYWGGDFALTPLHTAAALNDVKKVVSLLDWGAIPDSVGENVQGYFCRSPLHWAAIANAPDAGKELLERGATVNLQDTHGLTPLHWAAFHHHEDMVKLILDNGGDPSIRDQRDRTPLAIAAEHEDASKTMVKQFADAGADINAICGKYGDTAMHTALRRGHKNTAIALLQNGANLLLANAEGKRPLDCTLSTDIQYAVKKEAGTRDVMISYTHSHSEFAKKVCESLERNKITVWIDSMSPSGIGGGAVWREEVAKGIMNAAVVLCILTEDFQQSPWCMKELALAKQVGTPIVAISCEGVKLNEELQVYLYTRQIIPFEPAIKRTKKIDEKHFVFSYRAKEYDSKVSLLLDGLRDEIEKNRLLKEQMSRRKQTLGGNTMQRSLSIGGSRPSEDATLVFLAHGDCHRDFVNRLRAAIRSAGFSCYVDSTTQEYGDRIRESKDAINRCVAFVPILSDRSVKSDILSDQLAFAEDKEKPIIPILFTEPKFDPGKPIEPSMTMKNLILICNS